MVVAAILMSACTVTSEVGAQPDDTEQLPPPSEGWRYEIDPYAWLPVNVSGDATVRNRDIPVDAGLGDLTENLELGAAARFEAWNGRFGLIADGTFLKVGQSGQLGRGDLRHEGVRLVVHREVIGWIGSRDGIEKAAE